MSIYRASAAQRTYVQYIAAHPGCYVAEVDRACRRNPAAGHKWVYDGVSRLVRRGILRAEWRGPRKCLWVAESN